MRILDLLAPVAVAVSAASLPPRVAAWATGADASADDRRSLPRWDIWPPLPSRAQFTGEFLASRPGGNHLAPQPAFAPLDLFSLDDDNDAASGATNALLYGGVLLRPRVLEGAAARDDVAVQRAWAFARERISGQSAATEATISPHAQLARAVVVPLAATGDNGASEMVVVHQYRTYKHETRRFQSHVSLGINFYLTVDDGAHNRRHRVVVALDREGAHNLFQHTHAPLREVADEACAAGNNPGECASDSEAAPPASPRILSYNVWNTNPPREVYGTARRWDQYSKRMDHLAAIVRDTRADIIGFQEVRYDGVFGERGGHAQVAHLAARLPGYQFAYQAAMSYLNDRDPYERIEEGPAVFSKYPIVHTDHLLLSRDPNNPNDAHQRLCLHAVVAHPTWGLIDVYVTHLSLSESSREKTMVEIWRFMQQGRGATQVLLGDLNAEPQSRGIRFLRGDAEIDGIRTDLKDAWLETHSEAAPRSTDPLDRAHKFTFPSDDPVKRIDFVLYRGKGAVLECEIVGQAPTADTKSFPRDVGLLNARSPVYASDHRGVIAELS